ncbi:MAG: nucleotidyltransferase domain-containing protein [candidate division NC10 bacterium]|nr:nucleotidyltransferase domain-containing protein [candidate division NC10 bacterium]
MSASRFASSPARPPSELPDVILYGSYADGTYREGSDTDVVIVSEDFAGKGYWERIEILADAIYELFAPIEAVTMTMEEWERGDSQIAALAPKG